MSGENFSSTKFYYLKLQIKTFFPGYKWFMHETHADIFLSVFFTRLKNCTQKLHATNYMLKIGLII